MDVHNVTAGLEAFTCNAYLVTGGATTLVDAGAVDGVVDAINERTDTVDRVVLTHQHGDHVGALDTVMDAFQPDCYAYADQSHRTHAIEDGDAIEIGEETFEVVHTPGHADDHVSLVGETTIFTGDVVVHDDGAFDDGSFGRTDMPGQSRDRLIESIETLLDRLPEQDNADADGITHMYSGHGGPFHGDVRTVIKRALERARRREPKYPE
ncbi:MBL fold metallo-hydrolase [Halocatena pleomorpha]|uniref:MBL fold metallo-hydrolase n=1 Tax=Halocatena pleomorpha TaxID=1785090 RepID=A0A3P3R7X5_9EURY|nr:MBL fold metallo-hydrolase [Halocatena pleomorpha]RRJ29138.1 MBL fold metallo-hydrolase [Halocatena pleomorpha]